ncbi:MAG: universal stress protein [Aestuariivirgaceae bacterium]
MTERKTRKPNEEGHRSKFLVIVDESPECELVVYFTALRARRTNSDLLMLFVVEPTDFQHWLKVEETHKQEGEQTAAAVFRLYQIKLNSWGLDSVPTHEVVRHGSKLEEIVSLINEDEDISFLVLGASTSAEGPGWLVSQLAGKQSAEFPVPIVIIPGSLELHEIEALT